MLETLDTVRKVNEDSFGSELNPKIRTHNRPIRRIQRWGRGRLFTFPWRPITCAAFLTMSRGKNGDEVGGGQVVII